ncbi:MAG: bifunctional 4-hydroxy-2-oxoglutarate aldolase/2-dehydro-3-deoxy-phosphogluconate aldolase [Gammaproteobacteria bacterium]|nr:bifunctional 4-hydroxy-2-oxoglutarate aldolase/2-dehydro-3-deoxy-phosphogluconate aldolase [Gammaproteobacteria bacterium]
MTMRTRRSQEKAEMDASRLLVNSRIVPVVVISRLERAVPLAECLLEAGIDVIEITLRTNTALAAIESIANQVPAMTVGAGSLREPGQIGDIIEAGGQFAVSPGATAELIGAAHEYNLPLVPGAVTPGEMMNLFAAGYSLQKFFPAELAGGAPFLKSIHAPLPDIRFMPTGGISVQKAADYLALPNVAAIGGSWITPQHLLDTGNFAEIGRLAAEAIDMSRVKH